MLRRVEAPASKPDDMPGISKTHIMQRESSSHTLSSDVHTYTQTHTSVQVHLSFTCVHKHTFYRVKMYFKYIK